MSIRLAVARHDDTDRNAVDAAATAGSLDPEARSALAERHRLALELADALMTLPADLDDATTSALRAEFSDAELVELTLKVMKFNTQKVLVALRTDETLTSTTLAAKAWNADGTFVAST